MIKKAVMFFIFAAVILIIIYSPYVQNFWVSYREFISPGIFDEIEQSWKQRPNEFLLKKANSINDTYAFMALSILADRGERKIIPRLIKYTKSNDEQNRLSAFMCLAKLGGEDVQKYLLEIIKVGEVDRKYYDALDALSTLRYSPIYDKVVKLATSNLSEKALAPDMLTNFPERPETLPLLEQMTKDPSWNVRSNAERALRELKEN